MDKYTKPIFSKSALITIDTQNDCSLDNTPEDIWGQGKNCNKLSRF